MLTGLHIQHFALIDDVDVTFTAGESVVTGETGAGKSLFVDALDFVRGAKADKNILRDDEPAVVEATFRLSEDDSVVDVFQDADIPWDDDSVIVRRTLTKSGARQRINDRSVTQQTLREVMALLLDIHAQNAQSLLKNPKTYLPLLDAFIGEEAAAIKQQISEGLDAFRRVGRELAALDLTPEEAARRRDLLQFQKREIEEADLEHLDEEAIAEEYRALSSAAERLQTANQLMRALDGDRGLREGIKNVAFLFDELARRDGAADEMRDLLWQMDAEVESVIDGLERYRSHIVIDEARMHEIDQLFELLQRLKRKYGRDTEAILSFYETVLSELDALDHLENRRQEAEAKKAHLEQVLRREADALHDLRVEGAARLEKRVKEEMLQMAVKRMDFAIPFTRLEEMTASGRDAIDFQLSTNPGEPMHSLSEVASGGEMSRFMLSLKIVASEIAATPTLVFDEIDTGISGRTAQVVAEKVHRLSETHQIIVITHLAQIAALADTHYLMKKEVRSGRTVSEMHELSDAARVDEQARLIGGVKITEITRESAREMLLQAQSVRRGRESS
ncbi:MAG: DNA repair protein RecN [Peptoniphilaceae bacterium]|nr:DNA repair protein RecN [Peptoniphilaceae bacterium]MDY6086023.1 DNA repair protein RecN [Peptoniphilaceae bacterium]